MLVTLKDAALIKKMTYHSLFQALRQGRLIGAYKMGKQWVIDSDNIKIIDRRTSYYKKNNKTIKSMNPITEQQINCIAYNMMNLGFKGNSESLSKLKELDRGTAYSIISAFKTGKSENAVLQLKHLGIE